MRRVAPVIVSTLVILAFAAALWLVLTRQLPPDAEKPAMLMLGSISTMAAAVVSYWIGSSSGSDQKTDMLYRSVPADKEVSK